MLHRIGAYLELTRPLNNLILALAVLTAIVLTHHFAWRWATIMAVVSAVLIAGAGNALNDVCDRQIDAINQPRRPIPSGRVSSVAAAVFAYCLFAVGILASSFINLSALLIAILASLTLIAYDNRFKRRPLVGNVLVSFLTALAFIFGGVAVGQIQETVIPALFAFFFHLGREIIKDIADMPGDAAVGAETLPLLYGREVALRVATAAYAIVIVLTIVPVILKLYSLRYLGLVIITVDVFLIGLFVRIWHAKTEIDLNAVARWLKYDMFAGIVALYFR